MELMQWVWIITALLLMIAHSLTPGSVLLYVTFGAMVAALLALAGISPLIQVGVFAIFLIIGIVRRPRSVSSPASTISETVFGLERLIGQEAVVIITIDPERLTGRVRVDNETWKALSDTGEMIPDGTQVLVLSMHSDRLRVRPLPQERLPRRQPFQTA